MNTKEFIYEALWVLFWIYLVISIFSVFIGLFITLIYAILTITVYVMIRKFDYFYLKIIRAIDEVYWFYIITRITLIVIYALLKRLLTHI
jgi:ABC-type arginine transport system permease subunit